MKTTPLPSAVGLFILSCLALSGLCASVAAASDNGPFGDRNRNMVNIQTRLVQNKVLQGSDGTVSMALSLTCPELPVDTVFPPQPVDLVVVLDRSGSMKGQKINDSRMAIIHLMEMLSPRDRMAIISYANDVKIHSYLVPMHRSNLLRLTGEVAAIPAGGSTNLGGGLQQGVNMFIRTQDIERRRKIILISDGLANQGITDPRQLGAIASNGPENNFTISTVGVGYDFNEILMTTIADQGAGNYYFLEDPQSFAEIFEQEFEMARKVVASQVEIRIQLTDGLKLIGGSGYPIQREGSVAVIRPGDLLSGQERTFFLTFSVPTGQERGFHLGNVEIRYLHDGIRKQQVSKAAYKIVCVSDRQEVLSSIDKKIWGRQVIQQDYSQLKNEVATAIRKGQRGLALKNIREYEDHHRSINKSIGSDEVSDNLDKDVKTLRKKVEETFAGSPSAVMQKQKVQSKSLQYESYKVLRNKQQ